MDLVLQGWSVRQICSTVRCSHTTVQKARHTMAEHRSQPMHKSPVLLKSIPDAVIAE
ncbi:helix-turn-helix domain-containing protein [Corynebacterium macginleyi]|uniref:helix-turn-helix domain-containing protein n=1 Tax=Corynebacterium macginleyi TaxID=38290 RepID=UPI00398B3ABA